MTYSWIDFCDTILFALQITVPEHLSDNPETQADLCIDKITALESVVDAARMLLAKRDAEPAVVKMYLDDLQRYVDKLAVAGTVPEESLS